MQIWQRGIDFNSAGSGNYTADRWAVIASGLDGNANIDRSTDVPSGQGFAYSWKLSMSASEASLDAADHVGIRMLLEGQDLQQIEKGTSNAKKMTVSFWCKSSVASPNYTLDIKDFDNTRVYDVAFSIDAANTWEYKTLTIDGDTTGTLDNDNAKSLQFLWFFDAGSTYTGGTFSEHTWATQTNNTRIKGTTGWLESSNPEFYITGCQLEVGDTATPFEHRSYSDELQACKRYFYRAIAGNGSGGVGSDDHYIRLANGSCHSTTSAQGSWHLPVEMRTNPSLSPVGANGDYAIYESLDINTCTSAIVRGDAGSNRQVIQWNVSSSGLTDGNGCQLICNNITSGDASIDFSAEL
jgi:hypothetical protein